MHPPALFFHDETNLTRLRVESSDRAFRTASEAALRSWQATLLRASPTRLWLTPRGSATSPRQHTAGSSRPHGHGAGRSARPLGRCAVVGSSGSLLLGPPRGFLIDDRSRHDTVIRINAAPTQGFEDYAGRRTDLRVLGFLGHLRAVDEPRRERPAPSEATLVYCQPARAFTSCWLNISSSLPRYYGSSPRVSPLVWPALRASIRSVSGRTTIGTLPSTGAVAIHVAMRLCSRVAVFGFGNGSSALLNSCERESLRGRLCERYFSLGPGAGLRRCVREAATECASADWRCRRQRANHNSVREYVGGAARYHDIEAEWLWLEELVRSGRVEVECAGGTVVAARHTRLIERRR